MNQLGSFQFIFWNYDADLLGL